MFVGLINLLVFALVVLVVIYVVKLVLDALALPPPISTIVLLIVGLLFLMALLSAVGVWGGGPALVWPRR